MVWCNGYITQIRHNFQVSIYANQFVQLALQISKYIYFFHQEKIRPSKNEICETQKHCISQHALTFALVLLLLLLAELVQGQLVEVQAVEVARQHLGERLHGEGPLGDQLLPAGERGEHGQQVVPQITRDVHVQVPFDPSHNQSLDTAKK